MRAIPIRMSLILAAAGIALFGTAPVRADDKSDINALYGKIIKAMKAKDVKAIMALGTPDFTSTEAGHTMNAAQTAQVMETQFKMTKSLDSVTMKPTKIDIKGGNAVVLADYTFKGTITGQDGKTHKMSDAGVTKDMLVKTNKGWMFKSTESVKQNPMIDGKSVSMGGGAPPPTKKK